MYEGRPNVIESIKSPEPTQDRFKDKWVIEINPPDSFFVCLDELEPIPLTTDWLERAGYEDVTELWYTEPCYAIVIQGETFYYWPTEQKLYWDETFLRKVDTVHELQLLMAALGLPLTFNK